MMQYRHKRLKEPIRRRRKVVIIDRNPQMPTFLTINVNCRYSVCFESRGRGRNHRRSTTIHAQEREERADKVGTRLRPKPMCSSDEFRELCERMPCPSVRVLTGLNLTAMRVNEVINLPWSSVDEKAGFIRLPASYVKERKPRTVPIVPKLQAVLKRTEDGAAKNRNDLGSRVHSERATDERASEPRLRKRADSAGITDLRLHDFRHTARYHRI